jgi:hypothetical protein
VRIEFKVRKDYISIVLSEVIAYRETLLGEYITKSIIIFLIAIVILELYQ